jgi:hypothetical protein
MVPFLFNKEEIITFFWKNPKVLIGVLTRLSIYQMLLCAYPYTDFFTCNISFDPCDQPSLRSSLTMVT